MDQRKHRLNSDIYVHDPGGTIYIDFFQPAAVFVRTYNPGYSEKQYPCYKRDAHTGQGKHQENHSRYHTLLQTDSAFLTVLDERIIS